MDSPPEHLTLKFLTRRPPQFQRELEAVVPANRELETLLKDAGGIKETAILRDAVMKDSERQLAESAIISSIQASHNHSSAELLARAVQWALKQYRVPSTLALTDELTGLHNRRGFFTLAERQLKLAERSGRSILLFFMDVNGLKQINDTCGHNSGDVALIRVADTLARTFRESDVLTRMGGDEFAVLVIEADGYNESAIRNRLRENLGALKHRNSSYVLSLNVGAARFGSRRTTSLAELMFLADQAMDEDKRQGLHVAALGVSRRKGSNFNVFRGQRANASSNRAS